MRDASMFVGMHPDQATHPIVDAALRGNKPFAVVPCCVFGDEFQDRICPSTKSYCSNYDELVEYLMSRNIGIANEFLKFSGRNQVVYQ